MKQAVAAVAVALGLGLAVSAQAHGINRQSAMPSRNMQSGSSEQIRQKQIRSQRQATRHRIGHAKNRLALAQKQRIGKTRLATLNRHNRMQVAKLKTGKTRLALRRQNQEQTVGVGSSMPARATTPQTQSGE